MTINSPDDIGAATAAPVDLEPITNTRDVDWLRSLTEKRTERTPLTEAKVSIKHTAYFGIRPGSVLDIAAEYSRTAHFEPSFLYAEWRDGLLAEVQLSGPQRLKSGGTSEKQTRRRRWNDGWRDGQRQAVDKSDLPKVIADALTAYQVAVAVERNGARK